MGIRVLESANSACLYDSTTEWAFGPIFADGDDAELFLQWSREVSHTMDLRRLNDEELCNLYLSYRYDKERYLLEKEKSNE